MRVVAIIQARVGSTRLPAKVLEDIAGAPMLSRVAERVARARTVTETVVATPDTSAQEPLVELCRRRGWSVVRGSEFDVLARYHTAAIATKADVIVRVTSDCPLIDPGVIDKTVHAFAAAEPPVDYASNSLEPRTFPRGLDTEVFTREALERADREDSRPEWREHVTPYMYRNPARFRLLRVAYHEDLSRYRWTVDTSEDLQLVRELYAALPSEFDWKDVLRLVRERPDLAEMNAHVVQKSVV